MKKLLTIAAMALFSHTAIAQSDPPPANPHSAGLNGYYTIAGADTIHSAYQVGAGWLIFAGRSWVNKSYLARADSGTRYVTPYGLAHTNFSFTAGVTTDRISGTYGGTDMGNVGLKNNFGLSQDSVWGIDKNGSYIGMQYGYPAGNGGSTLIWNNSENPTYIGNDSGWVNFYGNGGQNSLGKSILFTGDAPTNGYAIGKADSTRLYSSVLPLYEQTSNKVNTLDSSAIHYPTTAVLRQYYKISNTPATAGTSVTFTVDGLPCKIVFAKNYVSSVKNKLGMYFHFYGGTVNTEPQNGMIDTLIKPAQGYSMLTVGVGNTWGNEVAIRAYIDAYQYAISNYNFDPFVYAFSDSMGTLSLLNIVDRGQIPFKAAVMACPVVALYKYYALTLNSSVPPAYGFTAGVANAPAAIQGYDPYARMNYRLGDTTYSANHIPVLMISGSLDPYHGWAQTMVNAANNAGSNYSMITYVGKPHDTTVVDNTTIPAILNFFAKPNGIYARSLPTQPADISVNSVTDNNGAAGQIPYYNSMKKLTPATAYYDPVNNTYSFGGALPTGYQSAIINNAISNRTVWQNSSTLLSANDGYYFSLPGANLSDRLIAFTFGKLLAGQGGRTVYGVLQPKFNSGGGSYYMQHSILDSINTTTILAAPHRFSIGAGFNPTSSSSTDGVPGISLLGNTTGVAAVKNIIVGKDTVSNGSANVLQFEYDLTPYADNTYNIGTSAYKWANSYVYNSSIRHLIGNSTTPTIAAGAGAGTSPTVSISGTDAGGEITITTGTSPTAASTLATITFNAAYGTAPFVVMMRSSVTAPTDIEIGTRSTTAFTVTGTLAASTTYKYNYIIVQ